MSDTDVDVQIGTLARVWFKIKSAVETKQKELDALEEEQKEIKLAMKDWLLANGSKSTKTDFGTISLSKSVRYYTTDYPNYDSWIMENNLAPSSMFEHRLAQKNLASFLEENPGNVPPGLNSETEFSVRVTKVSAK